MKPPYNSTWEEDNIAELDEAFFAKAKRRGRPRAASVKEKVTIRLDPDVLSSLKATGRGWQTRVNAILRESLSQLRG